MNVFRKLERALFHLMGPAQVNRAEDEPEHEAPATHEAMPPGYERHGTPGNYYLVKIDPQD